MCRRPTVGGMRHIRLDFRSGADGDLGRNGGADLAARLRPAWFDLTLLRRLAAVLLAALAAVVAVRDQPADRHVSLVVAARDLIPGQILAPADLRRTDIPAAAAPEGAITDPARLVGATSTGAVHSGEVLTDLRVVSSRLATVATGVPDARIVPMRLADNAIADILRAGDRVDVVAEEAAGSDGTTSPSERAPAPRTLASDAAVVLVSGAASAGSSRPTRSTDRVVLLALDSQRATAVAAASLHTALTVVFH